MNKIKFHRERPSEKGIVECPTHLATGAIARNDIVTIECVLDICTSIRESSAHEAFLFDQ